MSDAVATAFWTLAPGQGGLREEPLAAPRAGEVRVRTLYSGISRGTEALVFLGKVPVSEHARMRALSVDGGVDYRSLRTDGSASVSVRYRPTGATFRPSPGALEYFLTERYALYVVLRDRTTGRAMRFDALEIAHERLEGLPLP